MKKINILKLLFILFPLLSFNIAAQNTPEQLDLIEIINIKLEKAATKPQWVESINIVNKELRIQGRKFRISSTIDIDKIKNIKKIKSSDYYKIKIIAPWGVRTPSSPDWIGGSSEISGGMQDKKAINDLVEDLKKLISLYK